MTTTQIHLIAAVDDNDAIGKDNGLLAHVPSDLRLFKNITAGHPLIMGRKTFESLPSVLPGRTHYVVSRSFEIDKHDVTHPQVRLFASIEDLDDAIAASGHEKVFVIGGASIFDAYKSKADVIHYTRYLESFEGADAYFPMTHARIRRDFTVNSSLRLEHDDFDVVYLEYVAKKNR